MSKLAVIQIKGLIDTRAAMKDTLSMLRLRNKFSCVIVEDTPATRGMITKVEHLVAWGEVADETVNLLIEKRGKALEKDAKGNITKYKPFFRLSPPRGGFERKGTKHSFNQGGAFGYRGEKISALIARMV